MSPRIPKGSCRRRKPRDNGRSQNSAAAYGLLRPKSVGPGREEMGKLDGRVALVTGSGRGIGRAIALACAREGARIGLTSRTKSELDKVQREVKALGADSFVVTADLMDRAGVKKMVADVIDHFGRLDILINNGGGLIGAIPKLLSLDHDDDLFEQNIFLNLTSAYYATRMALPQMVKQDYGRIT